MRPLHINCHEHQFPSSRLTSAAWILGLQARQSTLTPHPSFWPSLPHTSHPPSANLEQEEGPRVWTGRFLCEAGDEPQRPRARASAVGGPLLEIRGDPSPPRRPDTWPLSTPAGWAPPAAVGALPQGSVTVRATLAAAELPQTAGRFRVLSPGAVSVGRLCVQRPETCSQRSRAGASDLPTVSAGGAGPARDGHRLHALVHIPSDRRQGVPRYLRMECRWGPGL